MQKKSNASSLTQPGQITAFDRFMWQFNQLLKIDAMNLVILVVVILIGWSIISESIRPLSTVAHGRSAIFRRHDGEGAIISRTLMRLVIGSAIGLAAGIPFGLLLGLNRTVADMFHPMMNFFQSVSGIAIFPIVVIWYGNSDMTVLVVILYTSFSP